jgi:hypothetical protein
MHRLIQQHPLRRGAHPDRDGGMCAMEMVAWLAGEEHSDEPQCACPVVAAFVRAANDAMSDHLRNRVLRPLVPQLVNTRGGPDTERARGYLVVDALVRRLLPLWLERHHAADEARVLRAFPPLAKLEDVRAAQRLVGGLSMKHAAAAWVLDRVLDGAPPARYVAGAVQVARALNDENTWRVVGEVVAALAAEGQPGRHAEATS